MPPRDETIDKLLAMPGDDMKDLLGKLSPETRQGMFDVMAGKDAGYTVGERYRFQRGAGLLPQKEVSSFMTNPRQRLGEIAEESGQLAQEYQYGTTPNLGVREGQKRGVGERAVNDLLSGLFATTQVGAKLAQGFTDPRTIAAFIVSKLGPPGALAAATYFGYQGVNGLADAIHTGKLTPENLQNGLLGGAGMAGSAVMGGTAPKTEPITPASIKARLQPFARQVTGAEPATREAVSKASEKFTTESAKTEAERSKVQEENKFNQQRSRFRAGEEEYRRTKSNQEIEAENVRKQQEFEQAKTQRGEAITQADQQATAARSSVEKVENAVYQEVQRRYSGLRQQIGADRPGEPTRPPTAVSEAVTTAERALTPDQHGLFRRITKMTGGTDAGELAQLRKDVMTGQGIDTDTYRYEDLNPEIKSGIDNVVRSYAADLSQGDPVTWGRLQRMKTSIETAMRSPSTSQIMKYSLGQVDDAVIQTMESIATEKGATDAWQQARDLNRQWREDFHTTRGPQGSASPIAQVLEAKDPVYIKKALGRTDPRATGANRATDILRRYPQFGGTEAATSVEEALGTERGIGREPKAPTAKPTEPAPTVSKLFPQKEVPPATERPTVNIPEISRKALEQRAKNWGAFNARDIGIIASSVLAGPIIRFLFHQDLPEGASSLLPTAALSYEGGKYLSSRMLRNPQVVKWLETASPEELSALRKIPGADKVKIVNGITEDAMQTLRNTAGADNDAFQRAKTELGPNASLSGISRRAAVLNKEVIEKRVNGNKAPVISQPVREFLGPENVAKILAASSQQKKGPVQNRSEALQAIPRP